MSESVSESVTPIGELVGRLRLAIAARPKFKALPIDIDDVNAIVAALTNPAIDGARLDHLESLLAEASASTTGTPQIRVTNSGAAGVVLASSYYIQAGGRVANGKIAVSLRSVIDADRIRLAVLDACRAGNGR